jgi:hypothetical protein
VIQSFNQTNKRQVTAKDILSLKIAAGGGAAIIIKKN